MADVGLFDLPPGAVVPPAEPEPKLSADRRRTLRQTAILQRGWHPLGGKLHAEAAPVDDRDAPGRRCGNCVHRILQDYHGKTWPKCDLRVVTHGPGSDCRAWWPGCTQHQAVAVAHG